jgi:acylpyruvate hydrolase
MNRYRGSKIVAVAKNYAKHKVEMGGTPERLESPAIFLKPNSSVVYEGSPIIRPASVKDLHYEVELGVVISKRCKAIRASDWSNFVYGYCLGLDMTARDVQAAAKKAGLPWTQAKGYDTFTALSTIFPTSSNDLLKNPHNLELWLKVDGVEKQRGSTSDMMHKIPELIEFISGCMTLEEGDMILTGTPEGIGPVLPGQTIDAGITGLVEVKFPIVQG